MTFVGEVVNAATVDAGGLSGRWPHIRRFLRVDATGGVDHNFPLWTTVIESADRPGAEMAAAWEQWADFFEWQLEQRAAELATADQGWRYGLETWTAEMAYVCRRVAAVARNQDPGLLEHPARHRRTAGERP